MSKSTTSDRLKQIMRERNLRQIDILNLCEPYCKKYNIILNKSALSQYVSGTVIPGQYKLCILGMALGVSESWLMGYDVPMERHEDADDNKLKLTPEGELSEDILVLHRNGERIEYHLTEEQLKVIKPLLDQLNSQKDPEI